MSGKRHIRHITVSGNPDSAALEKHPHGHFTGFYGTRRHRFQPYSLRYTNGLNNPDLAHKSLRGPILKDEWKVKSETALTGTKTSSSFDWHA
ncbi:hypothetical protein ACIBK8_09210 [Streptomyces sp. NPDC050161]|uniref:hypothetical protein n=1 Tax=Streptomyces sp. NPDC050161 TaxID=3365604 RepID=UPI0037B7E72A